MYSGWVAWNMGTLATGLDSHAVQVADDDYWPEMRVLILVAGETKKKVSSTSGMQQSVLTSELMKYRIAHVEERMKLMQQAIINRDFNQFAIETMKDSNQFHAICMDTYPPIFYLNDSSKKIISVVDAVNANGIRAAYTFDAGPNAVIYLLEKDVPYMMTLFIQAFMPTNKPESEIFIQDPMHLFKLEDTVDYINVVQEDFPTFVGLDDGISKIIVSKV